MGIPLTDFNLHNNRQSRDPRASCLFQDHQSYSCLRGLGFLFGKSFICIITGRHTIFELLAYGSKELQGDKCRASKRWGRRRRETTNFGNKKITLEIKRTNFGKQKITLDIKRTNVGNQKITLEINRTNFGNQKITLEIKRTNFGNQKIVSEIKQKTKESKQIIILVILLEHRSSLHLTTTARTISIVALEYDDRN